MSSNPPTPPPESPSLKYLIQLVDLASRMRFAFGRCEGIASIEREIDKTRRALGYPETMVQRAREYRAETYAASSLGVGPEAA